MRKVNRSSVRRNSASRLEGFLAKTAEAAPQFSNIPGLYFPKPFGGANPLPQTLSVAAVGTGFAFSMATSTNTGGSWLTSTIYLASGLMAAYQAATGAPPSFAQYAAGVATLRRTPNQGFIGSPEFQGLFAN